jgi:hypothetical protein
VRPFVAASTCEAARTVIIPKIASEQYYLVGYNAFLASCSHPCFLLGLFFDPEDGGEKYFRNVGLLSADYTALYLRKNKVKENSSSFHVCGQSSLFRTHIFISSSTRFLSLSLSAFFDLYSRISSGNYCTSQRLEVIRTYSQSSHNIQHNIPNTRLKKLFNNISQEYSDIWFQRHYCWQSQLPVELVLPQCPIGALCYRNFTHNIAIFLCRGINMDKCPDN